MNKWINNNNIAKIMALCISIILWAMVHLDSATPISQVNQSVSTRTIDNVKIQVYNFDENKYVLYGLDPERVSLVVSGKRARLTSVFSDDNYKVKLDLTNIGPGTQTIPLKCELPNGVECVSITPSSAQVTIEAKESTEVLPTVVTQGEPADGYQLGTPIINDLSKVKVTLPSSEIGEVAKVQGTVDVTGIDEDIKGKSVKLVVYDKAGETIDDAELSPDSINVDVPVIKPYKSVPVELKTTGKLPSGYALSEVDSSVEQVVIYGPKDALDKISAYPVTVDLGKFTGPDEAEYTVNLTPPDGFDKVVPDSLQVTIQATPFEKKTINDVPVTLQGIGDGFTAQVIDPESGGVTVTVEGSSERIATLSPADISFIADLTGYGEGTFSVPLTPVLPQYIYLEDAGNSPVVQVKVTPLNKPTTGTPSSSSPDSASSTNSGGVPAGSESSDLGGESGNESVNPEDSGSP